MLFTNPEVITTFEDIVIGSIETNDNVDYLNYVTKVKDRLLGLICDAVKQSRSSGMSHANAIENTADTLYSYLHVVDKLYPETEQEILEELLKSDEYKSWESSIYYKFMNIHKGVITKTTKIIAGGIKKDLIDDYESAKEQELLDVYLALVTAFNY